MEQYNHITNIWCVTDFNAPRIRYHKTDDYLPTPRRVSLNIHMETSNLSRTHTHMIMNWGQFIDHDITLSPESGGEGGAEVNKYVQPIWCNYVGREPNSKTILRS